MQDPNEDTEWNDILRSKGILPPKEKEITHDEIVAMVEQELKEQREEELSKLDLDELDELEDSEDEAVILEYRKRRIAELDALTRRPKFGNVREISRQNYVDEVNKAGKGIWVVLYLYQPGIPLCNLLNQYISQLSQKFPYTKFLKSIASTCMPNLPETNLPSFLVYFEGEMKQQLVGPCEFRGINLTFEEFEYLIGKTDAIETEIKEDPRKPVKDKLFSDLTDTMSDINDW